MELINKYDVQVFCIINKYDINPKISGKIESVLKSSKVNLAGKIPFDKIFVEAMIQGKTIAEHAPGSYIAKVIESTWKMISS